ncbi:MAG: glycogen synthase GlgA [candidate division NC10 bacterium]|nr:glycogen synthase GlgA [candidate division NC10 bacterium]
MKILFAASEAAPFARTGGLGDVAGALPQALSRLVHDIRLIMPLYRAVDVKRHRLGEVARGLEVPAAVGSQKVDVLEGRLSSGAPVYFVRHDRSFDRDGLYQAPSGDDYPDNAERYALFCRATLEACRALGFQPDVVHVHDWQTALIPVYLKTLLRGDPFLEGIATVFTIHNLGYQGLFGPEILPRLGLHRELFTPAGIEFYGQVNLLKGGLLFADLLTTVSPRYSREIRTPELGHGLDGVLRQRSGDLFGILNGIDPEEWNPAIDRHIAARYTAADLSGKAVCKKDLQRRFRLPERAEVPVLGVVSRLAGQKGLDLLRDIMVDVMSLNLQLVLLGSGEKALEAAFLQAATQHPSKLGVTIGFDIPLSHQIEAGADLFLMPSRYEPCGLNQMYSLAYGTIPVVRATGGLDDTIVTFDPATGRGNGFKFDEATAAALLQSIMQALALFSQKARWGRVVANAMAGNFTWDRSAREYEQLYRHSLATRGRS